MENYTDINSREIDNWVEDGWNGARLYKRERIKCVIKPQLFEPVLRPVFFATPNEPAVLLRLHSENRRLLFRGVRFKIVIKPKSVM